jgi:hypothetical protein
MSPLQGSRMPPDQGDALGFIVSNAPTGHDEIAQGNALGL